jgi:hypothetical protein
MSTHEGHRLPEGELPRDDSRSDAEELSDPADLNAKVIPVELAHGRIAGGALVSHLAEPVYVYAFQYPEKIAGKTVIMQFLVSGFRPETESPRTEQVEDAFGDTQEISLYRQLTEEEVKACGNLALEPHNGLHAAPLTRGSAIYMRWTKNF